MLLLDGVIQGRMAEVLFTVGNQECLELDISRRERREEDSKVGGDWMKVRGVDEQNKKTELASERSCVSYNALAFGPAIYMYIAVVIERGNTCTYLWVVLPRELFPKDCLD